MSLNQNNTNNKPEQILHCRQLLEKHESAWLQYQDRLTKDISNSKVNANSKSNTINWKNKPYNCQQNNCVGNCLWEASKPHQKCKCRALYLRDQSHLHAPCSALNEGPVLSYETCQKLGYLEKEEEIRKRTTI